MKPQIANVAPLGVISVGYSLDTLPMLRGNNGDLTFERPFKANRPINAAKLTRMRGFFPVGKAIVLRIQSIEINFYVDEL